MNRYILLLLLGIISFTLNGKITDYEYDTKTGKAGFVDKKGKWIVIPSYESAYWNEEGNFGLASMHNFNFAKKNNLFALVDEKGNRFTDYIYSYGYCSTPNSPIVVTKIIDGKKKEGVIDRKGKLIIPIMHEMIYIFSKSDEIQTYPTDVILVTDRKGDEEFKSLYDWNGKRILGKEYNDIIPWIFDNQHYRVKLGNKQGIFSPNGNKILDCIYDDIIFISYREIRVTRDNKSGIFNYDDKKFIIPIEYEEIKHSGLNNKTYIVKENGMYGLCGEKGLIVPCIYSDFSPFVNCVATVVLDGQVQLLKDPTSQSANIQLVDLQSKKKGVKGRAVSKYPAPNSDVDNDIPEVKNIDASNKFAVIIANENYPEAPVPYALNDGRMFAEYCNKTLNIPLSNIFVTEDATYANLLASIQKIKDLSDVYGKDGSIILYYAGHGVPNEQENSAYLFPIDGNIKNIKATAYSLENLYIELAKLNFKESVVFIDACFSGANRDNEMIIPGRGISVKVKSEQPVGNVVAFSASEGNETAHQLTEKTHGLFTYYLLKALQESKGDITLGDLTDYVIKNVRRQSVVINSKKQTPTVIPSGSISEKWRDIKL